MPVTCGRLLASNLSWVRISQQRTYTCHMPCYVSSHVKSRRSACNCSASFHAWMTAQRSAPNARRATYSLGIFRNEHVCRASGHIYSDDHIMVIHLRIPLSLRWRYGRTRLHTRISVYTSWIYMLATQHMLAILYAAGHIPRALAQSLFSALF